MVKTSRSEVLKVTYTVHIILILTLYKLQYQPLKVGKIFSTNHTYIKQLSICHLNSHKTSQLKKISARKIHEMTFFFLLRYFDYYNICHHWNNHNDVNCAQDNGVLKNLWTRNNHNDVNCAQDNRVLKNLWTRNNHNDSQWR